MIGKASESPPVVSDASGRALDYAHRLLCRPLAEQDALPELLTGLGQAFAARAVGLATLPEGLLLHRVSCGGSVALGDAPARWPWETDASLPARVRQARTALTLSLPVGGSLLLSAVSTAETLGWLLWLEDSRRQDWTEAEAGALALVGQVLTRWLDAGDVSARWVEQLHRDARQQRLEATALVARRLAHDYGNIFTGILGFTELSLGHPSPSSSLVQSYLHELHRSAQNGARLTHQLRLFSRRKFLNPSPSSLGVALEESRARLAGTQNLAGRLRVDLPADLPPVAMDTEHVHYVLDALLDNALEATAGQGTVTVSARAVVSSPDECGDYFGELEPGPHVALAVSDTGPGLSAEARQRLLTEPFFTSKPRHRGMGLTVAYGVLCAHRGGLRLLAGESSGVVAHVRFPVSAPKETLARPEVVTAAGPSRGGEKVLVVDDDLLLLNFVRTTLEQAGYRVQAVSSAEEALVSYTTAQPEPFRLVLSDVRMPRVTGVDLARSLLKRDANVRVLFMSGHPINDFPQHDLAGQQFELLAKPFRPEGLLHAVRIAIDRPAPWKSSARAV